jgi:hypothetical protein
MKLKQLFLAIITLFTISTFTSCTSVDSGHEAPIVEFGKTDMDKVLDEGFHFGMRYLWSKTPQYEIREKTITYTETYFDKNDMAIPVEVTLYYRPIKGKTNLLHKEVGPDYSEGKLKPLFAGSLAKVIPQFSATELNKTSRAKAEELLRLTMEPGASEIYVEIARVQFTKVTIPNEVANLAEQTAVQLGRNELAEKKEAEKVALAKAEIAEAKGKFQAAEYQAKTREILSTPKMLELQKVENERIIAEGYAKTGKSFYGEGNVFVIGDSKGNTPTLFLNK